MFIEFLVTQSLQFRMFFRIAVSSCFDSQIVSATIFTDKPFLTKAKKIFSFSCAMPSSLALIMELL